MSSVKGGRGGEKGVLEGHMTILYCTTCLSSPCRLSSIPSEYYETTSLKTDMLVSASCEQQVQSQLDLISRDNPAAMFCSCSGFYHDMYAIPQSMWRAMPS